MTVNVQYIDALPIGLPLSNQITRAVHCRTESIDPLYEERLFLWREANDGSVENCSIYDRDHLEVIVIARPVAAPTAALRFLVLSKL